MSLQDGLTPRTASNLLEAQTVSAYRIGFVVTEACPLRCAHCSVSAGPELGATTFRADFAERISAQMSELAAAGIRFVDFTGGEPTLARAFVRRVGAAAKASGMVTGIVTAAHWATSAERAADWIEVFADIDHWDISTDVYHTEFVSIDRIRHAFEALRRVGKTALIRVAHGEPMTYPEARLIDEVRGFAGERMAFQPVGPVGRARELFEYAPVGEDSWDTTPCPSTGPLVQPGGRVAPCCAPLSHERQDHPLQLGDATREPLVDIVHRWRVHPLLQTLRLWGFGPVLGWLREGGSPYRHILRHRVCHTCVELIRDPDLCRYAMSRACEPRHRLRLAYGLRTTFGERWLAERVQAEAAAALAGR
ncbi:radical SAM protein [Catellatospora tritici]|uniref:radical SAM protein n=1 Tax=Catellatospora tritici TaxID=2851566 RepID=UPI001C2D41E2|nr:radical SAM protein [Catellatospora tritici]MBV1856445.1 radical SAM protein [Catellatospora tritici]